LEQSRRFTWDAAARGLLDCFGELDRPVRHPRALPRSA
jgi:hypothetical protein